MSQEKTSASGTACPECKEEIQQGAKKCKHCGADLRNWIVRHPVISTFLAFSVILGVVQYNNSMTATPGVSGNAPILPKSDPTPKEWVQIFTLKGKGNKDSGAFATTGGNLRLVAKTDGSKYSGTFSAISIESEAGTYLPGASLNLMTEAGVDGSGETIVRNAPAGTYYVSVISGIEWEATVYEQR